MEFYTNSHLIGPLNLGPFQETHGIHESSQYSGFIRDSQQISQPQINPDPPQDLQARRIAQPVMTGHYYNGLQEIIYNPIGPTAAHDSLQGQIYAHNVPPGRPFTGNPVDEQPHFKPEDGVPQFSHTPGSIPASGNGSHDGPPKKAQRTLNASNYH
jgi:hypothetical protein